VPVVGGAITIPAASMSATHQTASHTNYQSTFAQTKHNKDC